MANYASYLTAGEIVYQRNLYNEGTSIECLTQAMDLMEIHTLLVDARVRHVYCTFFLLIGNGRFVREDTIHRKC